MARLTKSQWEEARTTWESDPREGFDWLAIELDGAVSRQAISKTAKAQGWGKANAAVKASKKVAQPNKSCATKSKVAQPNQQPKTKAKSIAVIAESDFDNDVADKSELGRPTLYRTEYADQAKEFCLMGATDATLAEFFEVDERTINRWKESHPEFCQSIRYGKAIADASMAGALYKSGMGLHVTTEDKLVSDGNGGQEVVTLEKKIEPSVAAQRYWLNNRQPKHWRDKVEAPVEINLNVFPAKEVLDGIYARALEEAAKRDQKLIGRRERLGILIEHDRPD